MFVFGEAGLSHDFGKSVLYHLEEQIRASSAEEIGEVFNILERTTGTPLFPSRVGYTIKLGDRQAVGRGHRWFIEDLKKINETIQILEKSHQAGPTSGEVTGDSHPVAVAYMSCSAGIFWIKTQWQGERFTGTKCGFVFTDIPFDDSGYQAFFAELGSQPDVYEQRQGLQMLTLLGDSQYLGNPEIVDISSHASAPEYIVADNPFYRRSAELQNQSEVDIPEYLLNPLKGLNRIPLEISGGYTQEEDRRVKLHSLTLFSKNLSMNTAFVSARCSQERT